MKQYFKDPQVKKNILTGSVLIIILICCLQISSIFGIIKKIFSIFSPFIVGCAIAFILNVPMRALEKHLFKKAKYRQRNGPSADESLPCWLPSWQHCW